MRRVLGIAFCCGLLAVAAHAQRGGGGQAGGFTGGPGGGARVFGGGSNRGFSGGLNHGFGGGVHRGTNLNRGFGFDRFHRGAWAWGWGWGWPVWGWSYWDGPYTSAYAYPDYGDGYSYQPNVTVVYPPAPEQSTQVSYQERANPVVRNYDQNGQEVGASASGSNAAPLQSSNSSSPIYLVAFKDGVIRAAASYSVSGNTLHYVTLQHEEKQAPLDSIDRDLSQRLNRERKVAFQLP